MKRIHTKICISFVLALLTFQSQNPVRAAQQVANILVIPFSINAEEDLAYLKNGINAMLTSRLAIRGKTAVICGAKGEISTDTGTGRFDHQAARLMGENIGADYLLFGSLTFFGDSFSVDADFIDVSNGKVLLTLNQFDSKRDKLIPYIAAFAQKINASVFGLKHALAARPDVLANAQPEDSLNQQGSKILISPVPKANAFPGGTFKLWKTPRLDIVIKGFAVGDVDGDERKEAICITNTKILICRLTKERLQTLYQIAGNSTDKFISVDVADINGNGKDEIFVSSINDQNQVRSLIIEYADNQFVPLEKRTNWYYRILDDGLNGKVLMGQEGGVDSVFKGNVYQMKWNNGHYMPAEAKKLPKNTNVFGFAYGHFLKPHQSGLVTVTGNEHLHLYNAQGVEEWFSDHPYGGSYTYLNAPMAIRLAQRDISDDPKPDTRTYLPPRIHVVDENADGIDEMIVVSNSDVTGRIFKRVRVFKGGHFESLAWDNVGLRKMWRTRQFSGYLSDSACVDLDNDGLKELLFSVVIDGAFGIAKGQSYIVVWGMGHTEKE